MPVSRKKAQWGVQIMLGVRARGYKFMDDKTTYYEGKVVGYPFKQNHLRIEILADKRVTKGVEHVMSPRLVWFLANGTPIEGTDRVTNFVEPVDHYDAWLQWYDSRMKNTAMWGDRIILVTNPSDRYWTPEGYVLQSSPYIDEPQDN